VIPGSVTIWTLAGIFLAFDRNAGHLPRYGGKSYFTYSAKELIIDAYEGRWTSAGVVLENKQLHVLLHHKAITFLT